MKRTIGIVASVAVAAAVAGGIAVVPAQAAGSDIVIGVEAPMTGSQANNGQDMLRGVKLAVDQVNKAGGVLGRKVRIVVLDDQANPNLADDMVTKAKKAGAVAVVGPYNSSVGVVNLPLYLKAHIVPVQMTSTNDTDGMGVTVQPKNSQISPVESDYVLSTGAKTVSMLVDPSTYTQGMADRLATALRAKGVTVTSTPITEGQPSYATQVAQALSTKPDLVYVSTYYPEGSTIAENLAAAASTSSCLMGLANVDATFVTTTGVATAQKCRFSGLPEAAQMPGARAKKYVADYTKAFGVKPGVWGIFTYDSANLLFTAIAHNESTAYSPVLKTLKHATNVPGATGPITIDPKTGYRTNVPVEIMTVDSNGVFTVVS